MRSYLLFFTTMLAMMATQSTAIRFRYESAISSQMPEFPIDYPMMIPEPEPVPAFDYFKGGWDEAHASDVFDWFSSMATVHDGQIDGGYGGAYGGYGAYGASYGGYYSSYTPTYGGYYV